jgi:predicted transcriptional regulator
MVVFFPGEAVSERFGPTDGSRYLTVALARPTLKYMEVRLNPDVQAKLARIAAERGSDAELLARQAIERFVDYDDWFIREVERGLAAADRGELLTHAEVGNRLEKLLTEKHSRT